MIIVAGDTPSSIYDASMYVISMGPPLLSCLLGHTRGSTLTVCNDGTTPEIELHGE